MKTSISFVLLFFTSVAAADVRAQTALARELAGEMVSIPGGTFRMGDLSGEGHEYEQPVRTVTVPTFRLGRHEVTNAQWGACVADGGCEHLRYGDILFIPVDDQPVVNVFWSDAMRFIGWLNSKTGGNYRLPSEAEWEYAARAGTTTEYSWGDNIGSNRANCDGCGSGWGESWLAAPVGSFPANAWGLHDMHGNVWEWVQDCWHDSYEGAPTDGSAWGSGNCDYGRVIRGGSWDNEPWSLRSASRTLLTEPLITIGFRLAHDE